MTWHDLYAQTPQRMEADIPVFGRERDGDCFDEADILEWRGGRLLSNWRRTDLLDNPAIRRLLESIVQDEDYAIDLACGPGMGLLAFPAWRRTQICRYCGNGGACWRSLVWKISLWPNAR